VLRGGYYQADTTAVRSSFRDYGSPDDKSGRFGFRVARTP
jgi:formylglycine-generating enzyme required for sulfatase activity